MRPCLLSVVEAVSLQTLRTNKSLCIAFVYWNWGTKHVGYCCTWRRVHCTVKFSRIGISALPRITRLCAQSYLLSRSPGWIIDHVGVRVTSLPSHIHTVTPSPQCPCEWCCIVVMQQGFRWFLFLGVKQPKREADNSPAPCAEVMN
jgi:hypothetical protein